MIKAIETIYNGYRFRSRLEARWAVFFDEISIPYSYEPQGFKFDDGTCYLPDFYLPWFKCYVEIKPKGLSEVEKQEAKRKLETLFNEADNVIAMLCVGDPADEDNILVYCNDSCDSNAGTMWWEAEFIEGAWHHGGVYSGGKHFITIQIDGGRNSREFYTSDWKDACIINQCGVTEIRSDLDYAKLKARQARFEHGEKP